ncbi:MAG: hypothetical protein LLF94_07355, partial [Chlamydiales bacterium]|nr:hypothetical protein [Chlamydiales bacterium]
MSSVLDLCTLQANAFPLSNQPPLKRAIPEWSNEREPLDDTKLTAIWQQAQSFFENECMPNCARIQQRLVSHEACDYDELYNQVVALITKITEVTSKVAFLTEYIPSMQDSYLQRDALSTSLYLAQVTHTSLTTLNRLHKELSSKTYREACTHYLKTVQDCIHLRQLSSVDKKITGLFAIYKATKPHRTTRTLQFIHYTIGCLTRETLEDQSDYKRARLSELQQLSKKLPPMPTSQPAKASLQELETSITALKTKLQAQIKGIYFGTLPQNKEEYKEHETALLEYTNCLPSQYALLASRQLAVEPQDDWGRLEYLKTMLQDIRCEVDHFKELTTGSLESSSKALSKLVKYLSLSHLGIMPDPNYIRLDTLSAHFEVLDFACTIKEKDSSLFVQVFILITQTLSHTVHLLELSPNETGFTSKIFTKMALPEAEYDLAESYLMKKLLAAVYFKIAPDIEFQIAYRMLCEEPVFANLMRKIRNQQLVRLEHLYGKAQNCQNYLEYQLLKATLFALSIESREHTHFNLFLSYCEAKQLVSDIKSFPESAHHLPWLENKFNEFSSRHKEVVDHELELSKDPLFAHLITALFSASTAVEDANQKIRASIERIMP